MELQLNDHFVSLYEDLQRQLTEVQLELNESAQRRPAPADDAQLEQLRQSLKNEQLERQAAADRAEQLAGELKRRYADLKRCDDELQRCRSELKQCQEARKAAPEPPPIRHEETLKRQIAELQKEKTTLASNLKVAWEDLAVASKLTQSKNDENWSQYQKLLAKDEEIGRLKEEIRRLKERLP